MIKGVLGLLLASNFVGASDTAKNLPERIADSTYRLVKKKHRADVRKKKREIDNQVKAEPDFDKVDLSRFRIQVGNYDNWYGGVNFVYAKNIQQVIDYYLNNPNPPLTAAQTDPSLVFTASQPDPKRCGYDYMAVESGYVSIISRALPSSYAIEVENVNGESAAEVMMKALLWKVFSPDRALALYNDVIMQMGEEDLEEQKKAYEAMEEELGIKKVSEAEKDAQKKQIKKEAKKNLRKAKEALGLK